MLNNLLEMVASIAFQVSNFSANSVCPLIFYDMDMPEKVKKLEK